jgi:hypothetical protein
MGMRLSLTSRMLMSGCPRVAASQNILLDSIQEAVQMHFDLPTSTYVILHEGQTNLKLRQILDTLFVLRQSSFDR